jgi:aminoglycoside 6'-N-acetyltransferase I
VSKARQRPAPLVRPATPADAAGWLRMRRDLWPDGSTEEHRTEIDRFLRGHAREPQAVLVAERGDGALAGFAELSIRPCAEGCRTDRVAYLEGWYVVPEARRRGIGRALVAAAEAWAATQECTELGSDTPSANGISTAAQLAAGFAEVGLVRCFRKEL